MAGRSQFGKNIGDLSEQHTIQSMNSSLMGRATRLFAHFSGEKAKMLREIGFLCLRRIGEWVSLDEEFTFWLYRHLDTKDMCIKTSRSTVIPVNDVDVSLVMGTQRDGPAVSEEKSISGEELCYMLAKLKVPQDKGCLDINHLENLLAADYSASSTDEDRDAFKIAAVLYSWAMIFSVSGTSPVIPYGLWRHVEDTSKIRHKNWSALILDGVRNAALRIQEGISAGDKKFYITGCPLFLQVFYIDNLDYGMHTIENTYLPRIYQFNQDNMVGFVNMDRDADIRGFFREYGATRALPHDGVVYSRSVLGFVAENHTDGNRTEDTGKGQSSSFMQQLKEALKANQELLEKEGYVKKYHDSPSSKSKGNADVAGTSTNYSNGIDAIDARQKAIEAAFKKGSVYNVYRRFKSLSIKKKMGPCVKKTMTKSRFCREMVALKLTHDVQADMQLVVINQEEPISIGGLIPTVGMSGIEENGDASDNMETESSLLYDNNAGVLGTSVDLNENSLALSDTQMVLYVEQQHVVESDEMAVVPFERVKWATYNSDYPECPFDLDMHHSTIDTKRSRALYRTLLSRKFESKVWFQSSISVDNILTGRELAEKMKRGGALCSRICDAVIQAHTELDIVMYGAERKHWKGYLPASFSEIVFGSLGDDYLKDDRVRDMFTGDQLGYDFEHCRKIVAPVEFDQSYSCYVWDLSAMDCQVLDPVLMNSSEKKALEHHSWAVRFLTEALVKCVHKFFHGWRLLEGEWFMSVCTDISQKCRPYNSAVYALHYARWYDGIGLRKGITDPELGDIRGDMLYQIVSMEGNGSPYVASLLSCKNAYKTSSSGYADTSSSSAASTTED